jgi:transposase-like protein
MPSETFNRAADDVLQALEAGAAVADAARQSGVAPRTVERWLSKGRDGTDGYAEFAAAVDDLRAERELPAPGTMALPELEGVAAKAARSGSVPAMRLCFQIIQRRRKSPGDDPLRCLDELAARRQRKGAQ